MKRIRACLVCGAGVVGGRVVGGVGQRAERERERGERERERGEREREREGERGREIEGGEVLTV